MSRSLTRSYLSERDRGRDNGRVALAAYTGGNFSLNGSRIGECSMALCWM